MTHISYNTYHDEHILLCQGHTGYGKIGSDILCSAVSILCYTLKSYLEKAYYDEKLYSYSCDIESGNATIRFKANEKTSAIEAINAIIDGFRLLSETFPENILYEE